MTKQRLSQVIYNTKVGPGDLCVGFHYPLTITAVMRQNKWMLKKEEHQTYGGTFRGGGHPA